MEEQAIIKNIIKLAAKNDDIAVIWLYGSRAKQTATPQSDYDLAIAFYSFPSDALERRLRPELLAIEWGSLLEISINLLSIVDINLIPIPFAWEIISVGNPFYVKDELRKIREELRVGSMYELDVLYHRRHYGE